MVMRGCTGSCLTRRCESPCAEMEAYQEEEQAKEISEADYYAATTGKHPHTGKPLSREELAAARRAIHRCVDCGVSMDADDERCFSCDDDIDRTFVGGWDLA